MIRTTLCALLVVAPAGVGVAGMVDPIEESIAAGFDLYQLDFPFFPEASGSGVGGGLEGPDDFLPFGFFNSFEVVSNPLGEFDFGDGSVNVGMADTIVRRTADAFGGPKTPATVDIEIVALSLVSAEPVQIDQDVFETLYVGLDPETPSTGQYEFFFDGGGDGPFVGDMNANLTLNYQTRIGAPDGPVHETGSVQLGSFFTPFSHFPEGLSPFNEPDKTIDGVNFFLNGQNQEEDFFQLGLPLVLNNLDDGGPSDGGEGAGGGEGDLRFFELAFEHANSDDPGDSADNPILPDETDGTTFIFNEAPPRGWFDPPATNAYLYETDGNSNFVSVFLPTLGMVPDGDGQYLISSVHGDVVQGAGTNYIFPAPVESFIISGIDPAVDGGDPLAFPTFLQFDSFSNTFTQTPIPEPAGAALALLGAIVAGMRRRT